MYTVITVILNANGFAIGSAVSLRESERRSKFRRGSVVRQVFLTLMIYVLLRVSLMCWLRRKHVSAHSRV